MQCTPAQLALLAGAVETADITQAQRNELRSVIMALVETADITQKDRNEVLSAIILARKPALQFRPVDGAHLTNGGRWDYPGAGRWLLHLAAHNPDRWVHVGQAAEIKRLRMAATRAASALVTVDPHLAKALAPAREPEGPGVRFRRSAGRTEMRWRRAPGVSVAVGCWYEVGVT